MAPKFRYCNACSGKGWNMVTRMGEVNGKPVELEERQDCYDCDASGKVYDGEEPEPPKK